MVVAQKNFRDEELFIPKEIFENNGHTVFVTSIFLGICEGSLGQNIFISKTYDEIDNDLFDAVVFVGGSGASVYFEDAIAHHIAQEFYSEGKLVCAICIAPVILAKADLLRGVSATVFTSGKTDLLSHGAMYKDSSVVIDGRIITANGPTAASEFAKSICKYFIS